MAPPDGYQELVTGQTPALFRRALLLSRDWHLAEDLVQDTAMQALTKWRKVAAADDRGAYLHTMLTNLFLSRSRKRSYSEVATDIEVPATVDPWPGIELELQVAQGLGILGPAERAVVVGRYMDDLSVAEVASQLGRDESWVRVTAHRALKKMRNQMTNGEPPKSASKRANAWGQPRPCPATRAAFGGEMA